MVLGMDSWKRKQIHSHVYRVPDPFRNEVRLNLYIFNFGHDDDGYDADDGCDDDDDDGW